MTYERPIAQCRCRPAFRRRWRDRAVSLSWGESAGGAQRSLASVVATSAANGIAAPRAGRNTRPRTTEPRTASTSERLQAARIIEIANEAFATDRRNRV